MFKQISLAQIKYITNMKSRQLILDHWETIYLLHKYLEHILLRTVLLWMLTVWVGNHTFNVSVLYQLIYPTGVLVF